MLPILTCFTQFKEIFLSMGSNLHDGASFDKASNLFPAFAVQLKTLYERQMLFTGPASYVLISKNSKTLA